jgi:hypothetical protein
MYVADQKSVKMPMMCETVLAGVGLGVHTRPTLSAFNFLGKSSRDDGRHNYRRRARHERHCRRRHALTQRRQTLPHTPLALAPNHSGAKLYFLPL